MKDFVPAKDVWRLFIAVDVGDEVRASLDVQQRRLRRHWPAVKWVALQNVHLSLAFLGDVLISTVPAIAAALDRAVSGVTSFDCVVANLGTFGHTRAPRVVWAGMTDGGGRLVALQRRVADAVQALGLQLETRPFAPHVTLARVKFPRDAVGLTDRLAREPGKVFGTMKVESVNAQ